MAALGGLRAGLLRGTLGQAPRLLLRGTAAQHTEASGPVEVDLKRSDGEDDGRRARIAERAGLDMKTKRAVTSVSTRERLNSRNKTKQFGVNVSLALPLFFGVSVFHLGWSKEFGSLVSFKVFPPSGVWAPECWKVKLSYFSKHLMM